MIVRPVGRRAGFALLTVLWVIAALAVIGAAATVDAREALAASRNRIGVERASWNARGCIAQVQEVLDAHLMERADPLVRADRWRALSVRTPGTIQSAAPECIIALHAEGDALDPNVASEVALLTYFEAVGLGAERHDLVEPLLDWIDADDVPRARGAERDWYAAQLRVVPRNAPIADRAELRLIAGFDALDSTSLRGLDVSGARISVNTAPPEVLATIPGFGREMVDRLHERVQRGEPIHDLLVLPSLVGPTAAELVRDHYPEIVSAATADPSAWLLSAEASHGSPAVRVRIEARLVRDAAGTTVARWRMW